MKLTVFFMDRAPVEFEGVDRAVIEHAGCVYRVTTQLDALGVRLDQPLSHALVVLPYASNGVDVIGTDHTSARKRRQARP